MSNQTEPRAQILESGLSGIVVLFEQTTMLPALWPLQIVKGATWNLYVTWWNAPNQPVSVASGYTAALTVRYETGATALISLTNASGITLAATQPTITATLSATATAAYTWGPQARYALTVATTGGIVYPLLTGSVELISTAI